MYVCMYVYVCVCVYIIMHYDLISAVLSLNVFCIAIFKYLPYHTRCVIFTTIPTSLALTCHCNSMIQLERKWVSCKKYLEVGEWVDFVYLLVWQVYFQGGNHCSMKHTHVQPWNGSLSLRVCNYGYCQDEESRRKKEQKQKVCSDVCVQPVRNLWKYLFANQASMQSNDNATAQNLHHCTTMHWLL